MAKHRADGPINDVMVTDMYIGDEAIGKIIMTDGENAVLVFDEKTVGRSVKKLLEPDSLLAIRTTDEIRVGDRRELATPIQTLPSEIDLQKYSAYFNKHNPTLF